MMETPDSKFSRKCVITAGMLGVLAVILGAFGAHGLKNQISSGNITAEQVNGFDTGVKYHMYHTIAILAIAALATILNLRFLKLTYLFFLAGIAFFSGSLYFLTTRGITGFDSLTFLGPVTPIGGLFFVAGWFTLCLGAIKKKRQDLV